MERRYEHRFEWDTVKAVRNIRERGILRAGRDSVSRSKRDVDIRRCAQRGRGAWVTLGIDRTGMLLVVCHTFREDKGAGGKAGAKVRLISARRADRGETAQYRGLER